MSHVRGRQIPIERVSTCEGRDGRWCCCRPDGFLLYGGPCITIWGGDVVERLSGLRVKGELDDDPDVGGYVGFAVDVWESLTIRAEYQQTADAYLIGGHVAWSF